MVMICISLECWNSRNS